MTQTARKQMVSVLLCVAFALSMIPVAVASAANTSDARYAFNFASGGNRNWNFEARSKFDDSYVYVRANTLGIAITPAPFNTNTWSELGSFFGISGTAYIGNYDPYFIRNLIYENYGYGTMTNLYGQPYNGGSYYDGYWSPDSIPEATSNPYVWP